ncbi:MAG: hypothetical protein IPG81_06720 [Sandaracinaceae bacterium]|nr:hypothetical protein [Sandaracinaceae bacterium]
MVTVTGGAGGKRAHLGRVRAGRANGARVGSGRDGAFQEGLGGGAIQQCGGFYARVAGFGRFCHGGRGCPAAGGHFAGLEGGQPAARVGHAVGGWPGV